MNAATVRVPRWIAGADNDPGFHLVRGYDVATMCGQTLKAGAKGTTKAMPEPTCNGCEREFERHWRESLP